MCITPIDPVDSQVIFIGNVYGGIQFLILTLPCCLNWDMRKGPDFFFDVYFLIFVLVYGCSPKVEPTLIQGGTFLKGVEKAKESDRGIILVSASDGCSMCEVFEADLIRDEQFANLVYKDYVVQRINSNKIGDEWLCRLLNTSGVPVYVFLDPARKVKALKIGALYKKQAKNILQSVKTGKTYIDTAYRYGKYAHIPRANVISYLSNLFYAQYVVDQMAAKQALGTEHDRVTELLEANNKIRPSFYNNYILSQYRLHSGDTVTAKQSAALALEDLDPATLYFNGPLRVELKTLLNKGYSVYDDPYIGIKQSDIQLGQVEQGKEIEIPLTVYNMGRKPLQINDVFTSCGCTVVRNFEKEIASGDSTSVYITLKPNRVAEFAHLIVLRGNAINTPLQLYIKGTAVN